jgi:hypothetical protein
MMDFFSGALDFYLANADIIQPILLSIFVLGVALGTAQLTKDNVTRTLVIIPVAIILYGMSFSVVDWGREWYLNLSTALISSLFALLVLALVSVNDGWAYPLVIMAVCSLFLLLFIDRSNLTSNLATNLSVGLVGAYLTTLLIRKEWDFSPARRDARLSAAMRQSRKAKTKEPDSNADFFILVPGNDVEAIGQRLKFLAENNLQVLQQTPVEKDEQTDTLYQLVPARIKTVVKDQETIFLSNTEARVRIIAFPDTVKKVYKQISEVLDITEQKRIDSPHNEMIHVEFKTNSPQRMFSEEIEAQIFALAREWRGSQDPHLQTAATALVDWAKEMNFIRE